MKSSRQIDTENKVNQAYEYAVNFYNSNNRGVENQLICLKEMMKLTGFDDKTCVLIQNPILALYSASDLIDLANDTIRQHINIVSQNVFSRLNEITVNTEQMFPKTDYKELIKRTSNPQHGYLVPDKVIDMSNSSLQDGDIGVLVKNLQYQQLNLYKFDVSKNFLGNPSIENLFYTFRLGSPTATYNIKYMNLSNNYISDEGANCMAYHIGAGSHPHLRLLDVSGNRITDTGEYFLVTAIKNPAVQDIIVLTQRLNATSKLLPGIGTKEEKIAAYKDFVAKGKAKGTYDEAIVVDKSWWGQVKNTGNQALAVVYGGVGFSKCHFVPEDMAIGYAQDKFIAKIPKILGSLAKYGAKLVDANNIATCYLGATDDAWTSEPGMSAIKYELCLAGEIEFCGE